MEEEIKRWTTRRKSGLVLVLEIIYGNDGGESNRDLLDDAVPSALVAEIRRNLQQQKVLGSDRFQSWVEARTGRFAAAREAGRPATTAQLSLHQSH